MGLLAPAWATTAANLSSGVVRGWLCRYAWPRKDGPEDSAGFWQCTIVYSVVFWMHMHDQTRGPNCLGR